MQKIKDLVTKTVNYRRRIRENESIQAYSVTKHLRHA